MADMGPKTEGRQRLSELAKRRHAEGTLQGSSAARMDEIRKLAHEKQRKGRIAKRVAEEAMVERNAQAIINVFKDAIHPSQPMSVRLKGAQAWVDIAQSQAKMELQEDTAEAQQMTRDELLKLVGTRLASGPAASIIRRQLEQEAGIVDADVVEEDGDDRAA
jgi:hypothetical protein